MIPPLTEADFDKLVDPTATHHWVFVNSQDAKASRTLIERLGAQGGHIHLDAETMLRNGDVAKRTEMMTTLIAALPRGTALVFTGFPADIVKEPNAAVIVNFHPYNPVTVEGILQYEGESSSDDDRPPFVRSMNDNYGAESLARALQGNASGEQPRNDGSADHGSADAVPGVSSAD